MNDNSRLLEEIINKYNRQDKTAYLITLDARKAFDSVDHSYLFHILSLFDFPPLYINNIKTIYNSLNASVLINGFTNDIFNIEQSVKQGDALSCALFIIAIEPLLRQINANSKIEGIPLKSNVNDEEFSLKNMSFADDITALCTNLEGIQHIIDEYLNFSKYSGIKLNIDKTEILVIGKKNSNPISFSISHDDNIIKIIDSNKVKICGITFSNCNEEAYKDNILEKILKLERQLNIWRQRNLTLQGKILIDKTFGISQLIYSLQATTIKPIDIKRIDDIIFRFIWNTKSTSNRCIGKINRKTLKAEISKGGLKAPDMEMIDRSIKLKHILRCLETSHPISIIVKNELKDINLKIGQFAKNTHSRIMYIQNVVETNKYLEKLLQTDIVEMSNEATGINKFYFELIQNHVIEESIHFNTQMHNMIKRIKLKGIVNLRDLYYEKRNPTILSIRLDCILIYSKIPSTWKVLLEKSNKIYTNQQMSTSHTLNKSKPFNKITQKDLYLRLTQNMGITNVNNFINNKHDLNENSAENVFSNIKKISSIKSLQNIQYKILHNVYPTKAHLFKWKIKENDHCASCNQTETLKHVIYECQIAKETIKNLVRVIGDLLNTDFSLSYADVLLGLTGRNNFQLITRNELHLIDELMIIIKRTLILQRDQKLILTESRIIMEIIKNAKIRKIMNKSLTNLERQLL